MILIDEDRRRSPSDHLRHPQHNQHAPLPLRNRLDQQTRCSGGIRRDDGHSSRERGTGYSAVFRGPMVEGCYGGLWAYETVYVGTCFKGINTESN